MSGDVTQKARLLRALQAEDLSSLEIVTRLGIINTTGRISDLRADGHRIDCYRDPRGVERYRLVVPLVMPWGRVS